MTTTAIECGLTKREYIACRAMQAILTGLHVHDGVNAESFNIPGVLSEAFVYADAFLRKAAEPADVKARWALVIEAAKAQTRAEEEMIKWWPAIGDRHRVKCVMDWHCACLATGESVRALHAKE